MKHTIRCVEVGARPAISEIELDDQEGLAVWMLDDAIDAATTLRASVLRERGVLPPQNAVLAFELDLRPRPGGGLGLRIASIGPDVEIEQLRPGGRSRIVHAVAIGIEGRFEVALPDQRRIVLALELVAGSSGDARAAVAGAGARKALRVAAEAGALWIVPTAWTLFTEWADELWEELGQNLRKVGITPKMFTTISAWVVLGGMAGFAWYQQYKDKRAAQEALDGATAQLDAQKAAVGAALQGEASCLAERQALVDRLGDVAAARQLQADKALNFTASAGIALELGGARMSGRELSLHDDPARERLRKRLWKLISEPGEAPAEAARCLSFDNLLGSEVPRYALAFHPTTDGACEANWTAELDGRRVAGRFGLSDRVAREFGAAAQKDLAADPSTPDVRWDDRWSATVLTNAVRTIEKTTLAHPAGGHPVMVPSQAQLWSLALFAAYNTLPSPSDGALDVPAETCVKQLLDQWTQLAPPGGPSQPILPDLLDIADGDVQLAAPATIGCPWPPDAIATGARLAIDATLRLARADAVAPKEDE